MIDARGWRRQKNAGVLVVCSLIGAGCSPTLNGVIPASGYPRQLLAVDGETSGVSVIWDVGLPTEVELSNGLFGTQYFQIPSEAAPGVPHPVAIRSFWGVSGSVDVMVLSGAEDYPDPRIDDIGILASSGTGPVDLLVTVAGANLDTDATLRVNGEEVESVRWGALVSDYLQSHDPKTFGYPIYHYVQLLALIEDVELGSDLAIEVINEGSPPAGEVYRVPSSLGAFDGDGDGLSDSWESGVGAPIDLAGLGANAVRKSVFIEVDWIAAATPNPDIWDAIEATFSSAPVLNPDGSAGIDLIIDHGQGGALSGGGDILADHTWLGYYVVSTDPQYADFHEYKSAHFDPDRLAIFHYGIFGRARKDGASGMGDGWGNDFMVTFAGKTAQWAQLISQVGTFVHELGHNLGLSHGALYATPGQWDEKYKPNLPSAMNYLYQMSGVSIDCDITSEPVVTYSQGMLKRIDEGVGFDEQLGICDNQPLDINGDMIFTVVTETNRDTSIDIHDDFNQWNSLLFDFDAEDSNWGEN